MHGLAKYFPMKLVWDDAILSRITLSACWDWDVGPKNSLVGKDCFLQERKDFHFQKQSETKQNMVPRRK